MLASVYTSSTRTGCPVPVPWALDSPGRSQWSSLKISASQMEVFFSLSLPLCDNLFLGRLSDIWADVITMCSVEQVQDSSVTFSIQNSIAFYWLCIQMCTLSLRTFYHFRCLYSIWARTQSFLDFSLAFPEWNWLLLPGPCPLPSLLLAHIAARVVLLNVLYVSYGFNWFLYDFLIQTVICDLYVYVWVMEHGGTPVLYVTVFFLYVSGSANAIWSQLAPNLPVFYSNFI